DQGYVLRRLIRRAIRHGRKLGIQGYFLQDLADIVIDMFTEFYPKFADLRSEIKLELVNEEEKFSKALEKGEKQFAKLTEHIPHNGVMPGEHAFHLFDTYGFPLEITKELAKEKGIIIDEDGFNDFYKQHQDLSRAGAQKKFKGGLADASWETIRGHTATHLLQEALRRILGPHVLQKGSNITPERLRFDFSHPEKMTPEQIKQVEDIVNEQVQRALPVNYKILTVEEAHKMGAIGLFDDKYAAKVKVYIIGDFSKEFCGGPHVNNTQEVGKFKIIKEEACSAGVRRIKAVVEKQ
ncbi:MAG: alanyl-tRNA synthetase AlaRS, partial [uncultured bacterium]